MANGELCRTCGWQETPHLFPEYGDETTCSEFISMVVHKKDCPVLDCNGNCAVSITRQNWQAKCEEHRMSHVAFMQGPHLIVLDIGS
jgi:hypothetical protein